VRQISNSSYEKVEALRKQHPDVTDRILFKKAGVNASRYYFERKRAKGSATPNKRGYQRVEVVPAAPKQMAVVFGSPEQIREVLGGLN
jgi:hypothetical protein